MALAGSTQFILDVSWLFRSRARKEFRSVVLYRVGYYLLKRKKRVNQLHLNLHLFSLKSIRDEAWSPLDITDYEQTNQTNNINGSSSSRRHKKYVAQ